ncbi:hypothetical protein LEP1GSC151_3775 [Leptospira interrogans serovar Grippotyphosa str. LT2186]|uniref:Uncharacterized protein n=1 Tax=Leptospira interrogans serovar Grippotyphosa str. LT2186 TaxID=1001599 RepID=M3HGK1_LEPIR|nr:hypothetical protein LEP1GSC151_3775 [Leptospira interrogans serovar Grippotyphosa str. LT2186]
MKSLLNRKRGDFFPMTKTFFVKKKLGVPTILLIQNIPHIKL